MGWINKFDLISTENLDRWEKLQKIQLYKKLWEVAEKLTEEDLEKIKLMRKK